jgi:uncharacterized protein YjbJ (UPF0337 family)
MKSSTRDKAEGIGKQAKGKIKATAGEATGNRDLRARGRADEAEGKVQKKVGDIKKVVGK